MKPRTVVAGLAALAAAGSLAACGGGGGSARPQPLDTAHVLQQARQTSETSEPYVVNDGAVFFLDTADDTDPISINSP